MSGRSPSNPLALHKANRILIATGVRSSFDQTKNRPAAAALIDRGLGAASSRCACSIRAQL
jgi:hypothetical protein